MCMSSYQSQFDPRWLQTGCCLVGWFEAVETPYTVSLFLLIFLFEFQVLEGTRYENTNNTNFRYLKDRHYLYLEHVKPKNK